MHLLTRSLRSATLALALTLASAAPLFAQPARPAQQDEFVPMSEVPPEEQLPAAPLVIVAYAFAWLGVFGYVISVARRLGQVQTEIARLEAEVSRSGRG